MLIYRVEHPLTGDGPFGYVSIFDHRTDCSKSHPTPAAEGITMPHDWYCGCESLAQLSHWFSTAWKRLIDLGFHIAVYDVDEEEACIVGRTQCVFDKAQAELAETMPIASIA
jgi:hypothetical protein